MPERQPNHAEAPPDDPWIEGNVQQALSSDVEPAHDLFFGDGEGHWFGPDRTAYVAFYPTHRAVEFQNANQIFSPRQACQVTVVDDAVFVDLVSARERSFATFGRDGSFSSSSVPIPPTYTAHEQDVIDHLRVAEESSSGSAEYPIRQARSSSEGSHVQPATNSPEPLSEPTMSETPSAEPTNGKEKQPRVRIVGCLRRDIELGQTSRGVPQVRFMLGEHPNPDDPDETVWHQVYSTKRYAERIAAQDLKQGEEIRVEGVVHQSLVADRKTSELKTRDQIYAYGTKRLYPQS